MRDFRFSKRSYCLVLIFLCFFWTSASYMSWLYRLLDTVGSGNVEILSEVVAYMFQAAGIGMFAWAIAHRPEWNGLRSFAVVTVVDFLCVVLAVTTKSYVLVLLFGLLMNLLHGLVAAFYLHELAARETTCPAIVFGGGYGIAVIAAWLLSLPVQRSFLRSPYVLIVYAAAGLLSVLLAAANQNEWSSDVPDQDEAPSSQSHKTFMLLAIAVTLVSLVKNIGFSFPASDIQTEIGIGASRIFYAIGLVLAGVLIDRKRQYGYLFCATAMILPFIMLLLSSNVASNTVLWCVDYFFYGFFAVFRIILFTEYCKRDGKPWMSCFGLLFGRLGDALGTGLCICLKPFYIAHVVSAAILFALAVMVLFALYRQLYEQTSSQPAAQADPSIDSFDRFAESSDISKRERDVLRLLLEKHSNTEISETLSISENTVKTHVRNILQKTDCKNRVELIEKFQATVNAPK